MPTCNTDAGGAVVSAIAAAAWHSGTCFALQLFVAPAGQRAPSMRLLRLGVGEVGPGCGALPHPGNARRYAPSDRFNGKACPPWGAPTPAPPAAPAAAEPPRGHLGGGLIVIMPRACDGTGAAILRLISV
jgi:hypothetical protein